MARLSSLSVPPEVNSSFRCELLQRNFVCVKNQQVVQGITAKRGSLAALNEVKLREGSLKLAI